MNKEDLYLRLTAIRETIDAEEYPEIAEELQLCVGSDGEVYDDAFSIAFEFHNADETKPLPKLVAEFMKDV